MILLDSSGLLAALDSAQRAQGESAASLAVARSPGLLSPFVLAELDYLLAARVGEAARTSLLGEVVRGVYRVEPFSADDIRAARTVVERYADLGVSLADASITVLRTRHGTQDVFDALVSDDLDGRIQSFDTAAATAAGEIAAERQSAGRTLEIRDVQIAGIAVARRGHLATRNTRDFTDLGVVLIDPWSA